MDFQDIVAGQSSGTLGSRIQSTVSQLAPYTAGITSGTDQGMSVQQQLPAPKSSGNSFLNEAQNIGKSIMHGVAAVPAMAAHVANDVFIQPFVKTAEGIDDFATANGKLSALNGQITQNNQERDNLMKGYYAGTISHDELNSRLQDLIQSGNQISTQTKKISNETNYGAATQLATNLLTSVALPISMWGGLAEGGVVGGIDVGKMVGSAASAASEKITPYLPKFADLITDASDTTQSVLTKVPNFTKMLNPTPEAQSALKIGFNTLIKNPIMTNLAFSQPQQIYDEAAKGKYGEAAISAATLALGAFEGGPVGVFMKYFQKGAGAASDATFGKAGFIDEVGKYLKDDPVQYLEHLKDTDPEQYKQALGAWKAFQDINLNHFNGDVKGAVKWIAEWHNMHSNPLSEYSSKDLTNYWIDFKNTLKDVQDMGKNGQLTIAGEKIAPDMVSRVGIGKFGTDEKYALVKAFAALPSQSERINAAQEMINNGYGWAQNPNLREAILAALNTTEAESGTLTDNATEDASQLLDSQADNAEGTPAQVEPDQTSATSAVNPNTGEQVVNPAAEQEPPDFLKPTPTESPDSPIEAPQPPKETQNAEWKKSIMNIKTGTEVKVTGAAKFPKNYFPIFLNPNAKGYDTHILESIDDIKSSDSIADALDRSVAPKAIAGSVGKFFTNIGLSPKDTQATAYIALRRNMADNLLNASIDFPLVERGGLTNVDYMLEQLGKQQEGKTAVTDLRQLSTRDIQLALKTDEKTAKSVKNSIRQAYLQIPLQVRGLGNKIADINTAHNPFAIPYSRVQSSFRYAYNPIFHAQEVGTSEFIGQMLVGGKMVQYPVISTIANIFGRDKVELDAIDIKLDKAGFYTGTGRGEFADEGLVGISAHLRPGQRATMAGMVKTLADRAGQDVDTYMKDNAKDLSQMLRAVVQYPKNSWMNSPMMTTLNLVAFPARFNIKVAALAAQALSKTSALNQVLILNSMARAHDWLNSTEGITWATQNADAISVLQYFSPLYHLDYVAKILTGDVHSISDLGSLGGLPFGFISQILSSEGIMNTGAPYVQPSTGQVLPDYIPKTTKAAAATALDDFISSLFSYPGAEIGLASKTSLVSDFTKPIINVTHSDTSQFQAITPMLSPKQQAQANIMQRAAGTLPVKPAPQATRANPMQIYKLPPPSLSGKFLVQPKSAKAPKVKPIATPPVSGESYEPPVVPQPSDSSNASDTIDVSGSITAPTYTPQLLSSSTPVSK